MRASAIALFAPAALAATPVPALAQAYQCRLPDRVEPIRPVTPDGPTRKVAVTGYTLNASWSPDYCKTSGDASSMQCSGRAGRFGFVLHGLWPEGKGQAWPQWCAKGPAPTARTVRPYLCMTPSAQLMAHEWAKHGTCMAKRPEIYFKVAAILWNSIRWPDADRLSRRKDLTAGILRETFVAENPGWKQEEVGLDVSRTGWLKAIRLCYDRRFRAARCKPPQFGPADSAPLKIWRGL